MADSLPEDVAALCDHAGLDSSLYKDFTTQRNTVAASSRTAARAATSKRDAPGSDQDQLSVTSGSAVTASLNPDPPVESHSSPPPVQQHVTLVEQPEHGGTPASMGNSNLLELPLPSHRGFATTRISPTPADNPRITRDRWSAIQDAFSQGTTDDASAIATHTLPPGSISLFAVGGGVGKTTIAATLARVLTSMGESVLLAGLTQDSILPLYFGARSATGGTLRSFLMPRNHGRGSLHLYLDSLSDLSREGSSEGQELLDRLCSQAELVKDDVDRAIMVFPAGSLEPFMPILTSGGLSLAIIVPDLVSAIGVGKLMRFFKEHQDQPVAPYFLINKFDSSRALHQEMRSRLHEQLGARLLPLVIRHSDDIQDALAAGTTIIDYAPGSAVAHDFQHLVEWILGHCNRRNERQ